MAKPNMTEEEQESVTVEKEATPVAAYGQLKDRLFEAGESAKRQMSQLPPVTGKTPDAYLDNRSPYYRAKARAKIMGPLVKLDQNMLNELGYDDVVKLRKENLMSEGAFKQYLDYSDTLRGTGAVSVEEMYKSPNLSRAED